MTEKAVFDMAETAMKLKEDVAELGSVVEAIRLTAQDLTRLTSMFPPVKGVEITIGTQFPSSRTTTSIDMLMSQENVAEYVVFILEAHLRVLTAQHTRLLVSIASATPYSAVPGTEQYEILVRHRTMSIAEEEES